MTIKEIEEAVAKLRPDELAAFRTWFADFDADRWDDQIARDVEAGKLDRLIEEARRDYANGDVKEL